ncbi:right-handed parallel beta-helix repeat-containing protein [Algoriphagus sp.]|uniref:right-handed parallel beta-helix repeat-containing protein n=1 Tax=Algoriphagus sp. TaxID=1872435 RepID=UPI0025CBCB77|nr:right-handed parallel beta-helix repeat-containing protein [Algoriphagus sp.]
MNPNVFFEEIGIEFFLTLVSFLGMKFFYYKKSSTRILGVICCLIFILISQERSLALDYYFSSSVGDDSRSFELAQSATTPWKSIEKLNEIASSLKGGDKIYFKRGDVFHGTIRLSKGGTINDPILFDAYGTGELPIITSLKKVENWENLGNGIYQAKIPDINSLDLKIVLLDNEIKAFGRYPNINEENGGYLTIQSINHDFSINGSLIPFNGKGGEVVIRKNNWIIDSYPISNIKENRIDFLNKGSSGYKPIIGFGYFIQNHLEALDQIGEWAYSKEEKILSIYLGKDLSSERIIEYASNDYLIVTNFLVRNLSFRNLHLKGGNKNIINIERSSNILVENSILEFAGENAIYSYSTPDFSVKNNIIRNSLSGGVFFWHSTPRAVISDNLIENSMPFQGMAKNSDLNGIGVYLAGNANESKIFRNRVINSGYNGIHFGGNNSVVKNNLVDNYCLWKQDGGGIYMNSDGLVNSNNKEREIVGNIILNGKGANEGTNQDIKIAEGIYLDDNTSGVYVAENSIAYINGKGIYLHNANNITIVENLIFECNVLLKLNHDHLGGPLRKIKIEKNEFITFKENDIAFSISSIEDDLSLFGVSQENYFLEPFGNEFIFESKSPENGDYAVRRNRKDWNETFGYDSSSRIEVTGLERFKILEQKVLKQSNFNLDINLISGVYHAISQKTSEGLWRITPNGSEQALAYIQMGPVNKGDMILIEMEVKSVNENQRVELFLENSFNQNSINTISYFEASNEMKKVKMFLNSIIGSKNESLVIRTGNSPNPLLIDNLKISKVNAEQNGENVFFKFNFSNESYNYSLDGLYKNPKGEVFENSVTIPPYHAVFLVRIK